MDLDYFKYLLRLLKEEDYKIDDVIKIVNYLLPKDNNGELLVGYNIYDSGKNISNYDICMNEINLSINYARIWIDKNKNMFYDFNMCVKDNEYFEVYMFVFVIVHEIMHSCQNLMANNVILSPSVFVRDGYKKILDNFLLNFNDIYRIRQLFANIMYQFNRNISVIERNANVEACMLLRDISYQLKNLDISIMFNNAMNDQLLSGYIYNNRGSFEETYKKMFLMKEYNKLIDDNSLSIEDRIRYGLSIDNEIDVKKLILRNDICKRSDSYGKIFSY